MIDVRKGQFWRNPFGVIVFVIKVHRKPMPEVHFIYAQAAGLLSYKYLEDFVQDYALVEDREIILLKYLPDLLGQVSLTKRRDILRYNALCLSEEEEGLILLNMLNKGEE